ncbi:ECF transporter S component [Clostridiaceae bacterium M8S5]|nr:ECF transporter S component [Clostridiaceae bacterium M8S5]
MEKAKTLPVKKLAIIGMLGAISIVLGLTPLGFIPIGPTSATIMHIPVIIGAILEGPIVGMLVGLIFGASSLFRAATNPSPVSFVFLNPLVSILPRVLIGVTSYYAYIAFKKVGKKVSLISLLLVWMASLGFLTYKFYNDIKLADISNITKIIEGALIALILLVGIYSYKKFKDKAIEVVAAAAIGTITNTAGVLFMIYLLYAGQFVEKIGKSAAVAKKVIISIGITNGIPETIVAMVIVTGVVVGIKNKKA